MFDTRGIRVEYSLAQTQLCGPVGVEEDIQALKVGTTYVRRDECPTKSNKMCVRIQESLCCKSSSPPGRDQVSLLYFTSTNWVSSPIVVDP